jgi:hypothetical protein
MHKPVFPIVIALALSACGGGSESGTGKAAAPAGVASSGPAQLRLFATGETGVRSRMADGSVVRDPSCMTELVVENISDKPLWDFRGEFKPTHAQTGEALEVVLQLGVGVPHLNSQKPLAPSQRGQAWKINVVGAPCELVQYIMGPITCTFSDLSSCTSASVEQTGLSGISPVSFAAARR